MADSESRPKRSRFDQTEPEPKRSSRFDRRSRSPKGRRDSHRSRSPPPKIDRDGGDRPRSGADAAAAAAAAAARINASIQAKRGIQHVDVPPIKSTPSPGAAKAASPPGSSGDTNKVSSEVYIADGDYIKDIEVNDLRNRYTLTKGSTQKMIKEDAGADVTTRGNYYPDKSMATAANPPLYLHVTSTTKEGLDKAVAKIDELMQQELPNLVDERRFRRREPDFERDEFGRRKWPEERIPIEMEPLPGFNLRAQVVGHQGTYVKHIQQETRCRVQIKGRGSGFTETSTGQESEDPMYLHVAGPDANDVKRAKELCEDLLTNVRQAHQRHKENPPPQRSYGGGYGNRSSYETGYGAGYGTSSGGGGGSGGGYGYGGGYGGGSYGSRDGPSGSAQSPPGVSAPGTGGAGGAGGDYAAQWAEYFRQNPEYAAYYYQQMQTPQQGTPSNDPPPPPPSGSPSNGGYNSVPPPPGM